MGFTWTDYIKGGINKLSSSLMSQIQDNIDSLDNGQCITHDTPTARNGSYEVSERVTHCIGEEAIHNSSNHSRCSN